MSREVFTLFDIPIQRIGFCESLHAVLDACQQSAVRVFFLDAYALVLAQEDRSFKRCLQLAEFCFSEGGAITLASRFLNEPPLPAKISSSEWVPALFDLIDRDNRHPKMSLLCLGGRQQAIDTFVSEVALRWPNISLLAHFPWPGDPEDEDGIIDIIEEERPSIILLGTNTRHEEQFFCRNWHRLKKCGVQIAIAGGQTIDVISGTIPITPRLARAIHLEWLFQMLFDPRRFYHHYLRGGPLFAWHLIQQKGTKERM